MKKVILTEEQFNKNKRYLLREYLEILKGENADRALSLINNLYRKILARIDKGETHIEETGKFLLRTVDVKVDSNFNFNYDGTYYPNNKHIEVRFNIYGATNYNIFKSTILHELTHLLDHERSEWVGFETDTFKKMFQQNARMTLLKALYDSEDEDVKRVYDIIYRLWDPSERNAYTTDALGDKENLDSYTRRLNLKIYYIRETDWSDPKYKIIWELIRVMIGLPRYSSSLDKAVKVFCNKSKDKLKKFEKKAIQRMRQHAMDPENEYEISAKKEQRRRLLDKIDDLVMNYIYKDYDLDEIIEILKRKQIIEPDNQDQVIPQVTKIFTDYYKKRAKDFVYGYEGNRGVYTIEHFIEYMLDIGIKLGSKDLTDIYKKAMKDGVFMYGKGRQPSPYRWPRK